MKILLINHNPVVSRLTTLSAKKENVQLDEIKDINELKANDYNVVFVDSESYNSEVEELLSNLAIQKKVLFYTQGEENHSELFNESILKPFLPSEVSAILREIKIEEHEQEQQKEKEFANLTELIHNRESTIDTLQITQEESVTKTEKFDTQEPILNEAMSETKKADLDTLNLLKEELEAKQNKSGAIKETEAEDKKATNSIDEFDLKLEETSPLNLDTQAERKPIDNTKKPQEKSELFELEDNTKITDSSDLFELDKEIEGSEKNDLLDFDIESKDEVDFSKEFSQESEKSAENNDTKILDSTELSSIKALLDDDTKTLDGTETLDDVIAPTTPIKTEEKSKKKKKKEKKKAKISPEESSLTNSNVIVDTLKSLQAEELRQFLRGAKVHISIEFPNEM